METLSNGCHKGCRTENPLCAGLLRGPTETALSHTDKDKIMWRLENCAGLFGSAWADGCWWPTFSLMVLCCCHSSVVYLDGAGVSKLRLLSLFPWLISPASGLDIASGLLLLLKLSCFSGDEQSFKNLPQLKSGKSRIISQGLFDSLRSNPNSKFSASFGFLSFLIPGATDMTDSCLVPQPGLKCLKSTDWKDTWSINF